MPYTKEQLLYLQEILSHDQWETFNSLGENGRLSEENTLFVKDLLHILKNHDIYGICSGWGTKSQYKRLSFIENNTTKYIAIDNIIKISLDDDSFGQLSIIIDDVIYKDFHSNLKDSIDSYEDLKGIPKQKFIELLNILNNFRNTVYMTNKVIYNKIFISDFPKNDPNFKQYPISINDI